MNSGVLDLARELDREGHPSAAYIIETTRGPRIGVASRILGELSRSRSKAKETLRALVSAWAQDDDTGVARGMTAWSLRGCEECALRAISDLSLCPECMEIEAWEARERAAKTGAP